MLVLQVSGMTCAHCVRAVTEAVRAIPGAGEVSVDLARGEVRVAGAPDAATVEAAIVGQGYGVSG